MDENCENCRYARPKFAGAASEFECHRKAPAPWDAFAFHLADLVRDIAWNIHVKIYEKAPEEDSDVAKEVTEAATYSIWPQVEIDDWCGEWEPKNGR